MRDQARFARPVSGGRNGWPMLPEYHGTPEQLLIVSDPEAAGMPTFPRSSWHPNRKHWPEPWQLAEYGINAMGRVFWSADHPDHRPDGHAWRLAIDLDRGEVCIRGHWQRMEFTTKTPSHEGERDVQLEGPDYHTPLAASDLGTHGESLNEIDEVASSVITGCSGCSREDRQAASEAANKSDAVVHSEESFSAKQREVPRTTQGIATAAVIDPHRSQATAETLGSGPSTVLLPNPSVPSCLRGSNNWPEPHDGMSLDERRGHRRVKNEQGDTVWRCGPGPQEQLADFIAWRRRLDAYFEQKPSKETNEGAAA